MEIETLTDSEINCVAGGDTPVAVINGASGSYYVYNINGVSVAVYHAN